MTTHNSGVSHSGTGDITLGGGNVFGGRGNAGSHNPVWTRGAPRAEPPAEPPAQTRDRADVGVITILSEETEAVAEVLRRRVTELRASRGPVFFDGRVPAGDRSLHVVGVQAGGPGQHPAAGAFAHLQRHAAPRTTVVVGIAGGIHRDLRLGDVVVSDDVLYYEARKDKPGETLHRGQAHTAPLVIRWAVNAFFSARGEPFPLTVDRREFRVHHGPIASGEAVIADAASPIRQFAVAYNDKIAAVETEVFAVAHAFHEAVPHDPDLVGWLTVRGISDHADQAKDDATHVAAARHAAAVFDLLLPALSPPSR
ncbi:hypothetical protein Daura_43950 [Dactylosporangium aurantiacum]|uniref:Nucleoside phosphorylase domain-containing protein n=1 Tax=Dactylosporangium aurantiacum TaxID=35754 RepID=A0A9Q9ML42_9ACTN|nr:hypothetical protein [Dactylosporangium aurantiacum]MDG6102265.1 hypothetical protein [Dactylosporangium aurantiacum]UWZ53427.1 hypothetical protein Daura_43950 [Dactylosporangium aurantiacum]